MKDKLEAKVAYLTEEHGKAVQQLGQMRQQLAQTERTILHIEGAIQVCKDMIKEEEAPAEAPQVYTPPPNPEVVEEGPPDTAK